jgi:hypothetical protein
MHCSMYMEEARKARCGECCCALLLVLMVVGALRSSAPTCVGYLDPEIAATANDGRTTQMHNILGLYTPRLTATSGISLHAGALSGNLTLCQVKWSYMADYDTG